MKFGVIVLCRYDSSRLPGKILAKINGKPILEYILERLRIVCGGDEIVVATSAEPSDDPIANYCANNHIQYFQGDKHNVAKRFLDCAQAYQFDYVTRINGDNIFTDSMTLSKMRGFAELDRYDFVSNVVGRTFPYGMSIEIVRTTFYTQLIELFDDDRFFEHVTLYLYENLNVGKRKDVKNTAVPNASGLRLALDTHDDLVKITRIFGKMKRSHTMYGLEEVSALAHEVAND